MCVLQLRAVAATISALIASYRGVGDGGDNSPLYSLNPGDGALEHARAEGLGARADASAGLHQAPEDRQGSAGPAAAAAAEPSLL